MRTTKAMTVSAGQSALGIRNCVKRISYKLTFLIILIFFAITIYSQESSRSLIEEAPPLTSFELDVLTFEELHDKYYEHYGQDLNAQLIVSHLQEMSRNINDHQKSRLNLILGLNNQETDSSIYYLQKATNLAQKTSDKSLLYTCYFNIASVSYTHLTLPTIYSV